MKFAYDSAQEACEAILADKIPCSPWVIGDAERYLRRLKDPRFWNDDREEETWTRFQADLRMGENEPHGLMGLLFWQIASASIRSLKWNLPGDPRHNSLVTEFWLGLHSKSSGKTPWVGANLLYVYLKSRRDLSLQNDIPIAASQVAQADNTFREIAKFIMADPRLSRLMTVMGNGTIRYKKQERDGIHLIKKVATEKKKHGLGGVKFPIAAIDELSEHPTDYAYRELIRAQKGRPNAQVLVTSNAPAHRNHFSWEVITNAHEIALSEEELDDRWSSSVAGYGPDDDPFDEKVWPKANPGLPVTPTRVFLRGLAKEAERRPKARREFLRFYSCIPMSIGDPMMEMEDWLACELEPEDWDAQFAQLDPKDFVAVAGVDLGQKRDLTSASVLKFHRPTKTLWLFGKSFTTRKNLLTGKKSREQYIDWEKDGHIQTNLGDVTDWAKAADWLKDRIHEHHIQCMAFDKWQIESFLSYLGKGDNRVSITKNPKRGGVLVAEHPQNFNQMGGYSRETPTRPPVLWMEKSIEALLEAAISRRLHVRRDPLLTAAVENVEIEYSDDADQNRKVNRLSPVHIDPLVSTLFAFGILQHALTSHRLTPSQMGLYPQNFSQKAEGRPLQ